MPLEMVRWGRSGLGARHGCGVHGVHAGHAHGWLGRKRLTGGAHGPAGEGARGSGQRRQAGPSWQRDMGQWARVRARGTTSTGGSHSVERARARACKLGQKAEGEGVLGYFGF
jgi:hypothetical protein